MSKDNHSTAKSLSNNNDKDYIKNFDITLTTIEKQNLNVNDFSQTKNKQIRFQRIAIILFLMLHTTAASMVIVATGLPQKAIIRYKKDLEKLELFNEIERRYCKLICFRAWCLTTNKKLFIPKFKRNE